MDSISQRASALKQQIIDKEKELQHLKSLLVGIEETQATITPPPQEHITSQDVIPPPNPKWPLSSEEYQRYGRQMIVPNIGIQGLSITLPPLSLLITIYFLLFFF